MSELKDLAAEATALAERCRAAGRPDAAGAIESCIRAWPSTTEALIDLQDTLLRLSRTERRYLPRQELRAMRALARAARRRTGLIPAWHRMLPIILAAGMAALFLGLLLLLLSTH